jgi:hypothetical protein
MADPVSWLMIEKGWKVVSVDGDHLGHVTAIDAEVELDIFDGIEFRHLILEHVCYVPSEQVETIFPGEVKLGLTAGEANQLPPR